MKLLKILPAAALMFGSVATINAQEDASNRDSMAPSFGVKGGVNFATVNGDDFDSPDSRTSFHVGVVGEMPVGSFISIQAEALYSGQGFEVDGGGFFGDRKVEYQIDYINVPVLGKFYLTDGLSVEAGPQFNFKVNEEIDFDANDDDGDWNRDEVKSFDFGVAAGVTFQTSMGLFAYGRYTQGLTDIIDDADVKNSVFQLGIGFKF
ncbi:porin family protein [Flavobacterium rhizosphaerae]